jgi:hypothetical protein
VPGIVLQGARTGWSRPPAPRLLADLQPGWPVHLLDGVGHVPQIEAPERTAGCCCPSWTASTAPPGRVARPADDLLAAPRDR